MYFQQLLQPDRVLCNAEAGSKKHALEVLSKLLVRSDEGLSTDDVFRALVDRERLGCTALAAGIALPHAKLANIDAPIGAFLRLSDAVDFDANDDEPVDLICGVLVPEQFTDKDSFSRLVRTLSSADAGELLRACRTSGALFEALTGLEQTAPYQVSAKS